MTQQSRRIVHSAPSALIALGLMAALASCASAPTSGEGSTPTEPPSETSTQSVAEACDISGGAISDLTDRARAEIAEAGSGVAAGEIPDLSALGDTLSGSLDEVRAGVENSEVSAALAEIRTSLEGFGDIAQPDSLFGAPAYLGELRSQLERLNAASGELQALCGKG